MQLETANNENPRPSAGKYCQVLNRRNNRDRIYGDDLRDSFSGYHRQKGCLALSLFVENELLSCYDSNHRLRQRFDASRL